MKNLEDQFFLNLYEKISKRIKLKGHAALKICFFLR